MPKHELIKRAEISELISADAIATRVREMGEEIARDYASSRLTTVAILKGSLPFFADLTRAIDLPQRFDYLAVSSYHGGTTSSGSVKFITDLRESIEGRDVLLVEDIVDTGLTMSHLFKVLEMRSPASIRLATLLDKPSRRKADVEISYTGFTIPDRFVVGYGLDYDEYFRNLPFVGTLEGPSELLGG